MAKNLFLHLCEALHIPHTSNYTNQLFDAHPYKYTLFGLYRLLTEYEVESEGIQFADKEEALSSLQVPFVAQVANDLAIVTGITDTEVTYTWYDKTLRVSRELFLSQWSGIALLVSPSSESGEPHYEAHRRAEQILRLKRWGAVGSMAVILVCLLVRQAPLFTLLHALMLLLNAAGIFVSYLLLLRQLNISSATADRLCNLLKRATCTDVLETPAAIAAFGISWSEVGAAYFASNLLALLLEPSLLPLIACLSIGAVGYVLWSLWYQRFRAHSWCTLCLLIQAVLILQAITSVLYLCFSPAAPPLCLSHIIPSSLFTFHFSLFIFPFSSFLLYFSLFLFFLLSLNLTLPIITKARKAEQWKGELNSFKLKREVFETLLHKEKHFEPEATSSILFGNPDSPFRLTLLTNPYCNPCAAMHARLSGIRQTDCCVEMVFSSFGAEYDRTCRWQIAAYQQLGADRAWTLFEEWYAGGKAKGEAFFDGLGLNPDAEEVSEEYARHRAWREQTGFSATPTLLVNGYKMPQSYQIEDFINLTKLEL